MSDFADFDQAADPMPTPLAPTSGATAADPFGVAPTLAPYTKWYNIHERHSLAEFKAEGIILAVMAVVLVLHLFGASLNRTKAKKWIRANGPPLTAEFASVGFSGMPLGVAGKKGDELNKALSDFYAKQGDNLIKEKSLFEFAAYATGRANVAFVDVKLTLLKRFNPLTVIFEALLGFAFDSPSQTQDVLEATLYPFDGREAKLVPGLPGAAELHGKDSKSAFDGFVWAVVHKEHMKQVRDDRYDVSLTVTKDHAKLPNWLTVMSESAEITDALLTPELIKAVELAGDNFEYLIVSDQPIDKPKTYAAPPGSPPFTRSLFLPMLTHATNPTGSTRRPPASASTSSTASRPTTTTPTSSPSSSATCAWPTGWCRWATSGPRCCARSSRRARRPSSSSRRRTRTARPRSARRSASAPRRPSATRSSTRSTPRPRRSTSTGSARRR